MKIYEKGNMPNFNYSLTLLDVWMIRFMWNANQQEHRLLPKQKLMIENLLESYRKYVQNGEKNEAEMTNKIREYILYVKSLKQQTFIYEGGKRLRVNMNSGKEEEGEEDEWYDAQGLELSEEDKKLPEMDTSKSPFEIWFTTVFQTIKENPGLTEPQVLELIRKQNEGVPLKKPDFGNGDLTKEDRKFINDRLEERRRQRIREREELFKRRDTGMEQRERDTGMESRERDTGRGTKQVQVQVKKDTMERDETFQRMIRDQQQATTALAERVNEMFELLQKQGMTNGNGEPALLQVKKMTKEMAEKMTDVHNETIGKQGITDVSWKNIPQWLKLQFAKGIKNGILSIAKLPINFTNLVITKFIYNPLVRVYKFVDSGIELVWGFVLVFAIIGGVVYIYHTSDMSIIHNMINNPILKATVDWTTFPVRWGLDKFNETVVVVLWEYLQSLTSILYNYMAYILCTMLKSIMPSGYAFSWLELDCNKFITQQGLTL